MINKSYKASWVPLSSGGSEDEMLFGHNGLLGDDQEKVEQVEQQAISNDQVEEIKHSLDDKRDDP